MACRNKPSKGKERNLMWKCKKEGCNPRWVERDEIWHTYLLVGYQLNDESLEDPQILKDYETDSDPVSKLICPTCGQEVYWMEEKPLHD